MKVLIVAEGASELEGALKTIISRLASAELDIHQDKVSAGRIHAHHGKGQGYFKRAVRWMIEAEKRGFDAVILVIDEDGRHERTKEFTEAQNYAGRKIRRALGVAIRTFDAWMLADEVALTKVLNFPINCQPDPETIRHPKRALGSIHERIEEAQTAAAIYSEIADHINLDTLETRCPKGFAPFAQRVRALAG
ncbi:MAG: DUF4276 family protein [Chthoniobacterales bacterium]|nr:DUF4276 family protein [Chthoniobacterales bacterium]